MRHEIRNLVVISDTHCGCKLGLCPESLSLRLGGTYQASEYQLIILERWNMFWDQWVPVATKGEPYAILINGDPLENMHHRSVQQISHDRADHVMCARIMLEPLIERSEGRIYMTNGSPAHGGLASVDEAELAELLRAVPDKDGNRVRGELFIQIGSALIHAAHHIGVTSSLQYITTALAKEISEMMAGSAMSGKRPPNILVRSHRHRKAEARLSGFGGEVICFVTAGWQLKTPFLFHTAGGKNLQPQIGGSMIRSGDRMWYAEHAIWEMDRPETEVPRFEVIDD